MQELPNVVELPMWNIVPLRLEMHIAGQSRFTEMLVELRFGEVSLAVVVNLSIDRRVPQIGEPLVELYQIGK
jgi:hypothetical protein